MIFDIGISNGLDIVCPTWWIATSIVSRLCHFQRDLNKIYEGVDFKPFMRFQILLKFVFMGCLMNKVDGPRIMNFWVAACFWTCMELERFCFVKYYCRGPLHSIDIMHSVVNHCMPAALLMHMWSSFLTFGVSWSLYDTSYTPFPPAERYAKEGEPVLKYNINKDVLVAFGVYWALAAIFVIRAVLMTLEGW